MNKLILMTALVAMTMATSQTFAANSIDHTVGVGARFYQGHSSFTNQPFMDGDLAWTLCYECHEPKNPIFWQLALGYAPSMDNEAIDSVLTPEFDLLYEEEHFRAGLGILDSFVNYADSGSDSTDIYYHFIFGIKQDLGSITIALDALYAFDDWGNLGDFEFDDMEYGLWVTYQF